METRYDLSQHPCFNAGARHSTGRVHLPVAPRCNVQCNFCNRKYDCANESRPGVTSAVLAPGQALEYLKTAVARVPRLAVAGIAGPGDPFANPDETLETLELVRRHFPHLLTCVATNGFALTPYLERLARLRVSHVTITVNAVDPAIGAKIYAWVRPGKSAYRGEAGAQLLIREQRSAVEGLKRLGMTVKINMIVVPGVNDEHVVDVARSVAALGADVMNCIPLYPAAGSEFETLGSPDPRRIRELREKVTPYMPQMLHCTRCRADAVGMLGAPMSREMKECLMKSSTAPLTPRENRPFVAVASREGLMVNQHLGEAAELWVYEKAGGENVLVAKRAVPSPGGGDERWEELSRILADCRMVLVSGAGAKPSKILDKNGIQVVIMEGMIRDGLSAAFGDGDFRRLKIMWEGCGASCSGKGQGCG